MSPLHLIPAPLHRRLYRLAYRLRRYLYRATGQTINGCSVVVRDEKNWFLLVRHSYGPDVWTFPGGGIGRNEAPLAAARREMREELGCTIGDLRCIGRFREPYLNASNVVHVFTGTIEGSPRIDHREIVEARFFERGAFPRNLSRTVAPRMRLIDRMEGEAEHSRRSEEG